jgi:hypothetical protein
MINSKKLQKHFSNEIKIHFFIEDTHLPPKISKYINSHLQGFPSWPKTGLDENMKAPKAGLVL